jgi:hypothetical protein
MWNEFLPISIPITAILLSRVWDMACSFVFGAPSPASFAGGEGARPDHAFPNLLQYDPIKLCLVSSLARPGGNVTGVTLLSTLLSAENQPNSIRIK